MWSLTWKSLLPVKDSQDENSSGTILISLPSTTLHHRECVGLHEHWSEYKRERRREGMQEGLGEGWKPWFKIAIGYLQPTHCHKLQVGERFDFQILYGVQERNGWEYGWEFQWSEWTMKAERDHSTLIHSLTHSPTHPLTQPPSIFLSSLRHHQHFI